MVYALLIIISSYFFSFSAHRRWEAEHSWFCVHILFSTNLFLPWSVVCAFFVCLIWFSHSNLLHKGIHISRANIICGRNWSQKWRVMSSSYACRVFFPSRPHRQSGHDTTTKNFKFMIRILFIVQQRKCDSTLDSSMLFLLFLCSFSARHTCQEVFRLVLVSHFDVVVSACVSLFILHFTSRGRRRGTQKIICFHWKIFFHVLLMKREGALKILFSNWISHDCQCDLSRASSVFQP